MTNKKIVEVIREKLDGRILKNREKFDLLDKHLEKGLFTYNENGDLKDYKLEFLYDDIHVFISKEYTTEIEIEELIKELKKEEYKNDEEYLDLCLEKIGHPFHLDEVKKIFVQKWAEEYIKDKEVEKEINPEEIDNFLSSNKITREEKQLKLYKHYKDGIFSFNTDHLYLSSRLEFVIDDNHIFYTNGDNYALLVKEKDLIEAHDNTLELYFDKNQMENYYSENEIKLSKESIKELHIFAENFDSDFLYKYYGRKDEDLEEENKDNEKRVKDILLKVFKDLDLKEDRLDYSIIDSENLDDAVVYIRSLVDFSHNSEDKFKHILLEDANDEELEIIIKSGLEDWIYDLDERYEDIPFINKKESKDISDFFKDIPPFLDKKEDIDNFLTKTKEVVEIYENELKDIEEKLNKEDNDIKSRKETSLDFVNNLTKEEIEKAALIAFTVLKVDSDKSKVEVEEEYFIFTLIPRYLDEYTKTEVRVKKDDIAEYLPKNITSLSKAFVELIKANMEEYNVDKSINKMLESKKYDKLFIDSIDDIIEELTRAKDIYEKIKLS